MSDSSHTVIALVGDVVFFNRIARIFEPHTSVRILRADSVEEADDLIRNSATVGGGDVAVIVVGQSKGLARQAATLSGRHPGGGPKPSLLVLGPTLADDELIEMLAAGIEGFISDKSGPEAIRLAVKCIAHDLAVLPRGLHRRIGKLLTEVREMAGDVRPAPLLTFREKEILGWIVAGQSNIEIASALSVSEGTVKTHVKAILRKTRSKNRTQAALHAVRHHIIER